MCVRGFWVYKLSKMSKPLNISDERKEIMTQQEEILAQREEIRRELRQEKMELEQEFQKMRQEKMEIQQEIVKLRQEKKEFLNMINKEKHNDIMPQWYYNLFGYTKLPPHMVEIDLNGPYKSWLHYDESSEKPTHEWVKTSSRSDQGCNICYGVRDRNRGFITLRYHGSNWLRDDMSSIRLRDEFIKGGRSGRIKDPKKKDYPFYEFKYQNDEQLARQKVYYERNLANKSAGVSFIYVSLKDKREHFSEDFNQHISKRIKKKILEKNLAKK